MKKTINYLICMLAATGLSHVVGAQELSLNTKKENQIELINADSTMNQRMEMDLNKRNAWTTNQLVTWKQIAYGYNGSYSSENVQYIARYDRDGNYVETLTKKEWNANAPAKLKSLYDQSNYKSQKVTGYWEVTDPSRKGYYLELKDDQNQTSKVWVDEEGKFSPSPSYLRAGKKKDDTYMVSDTTIRKDQ